MFPSGKMDDLEKEYKKGEVKCYSRPVPEPKHGFRRAGCRGGVKFEMPYKLNIPPCAGSETVRIVQMPSPDSFF